MARSTERAAARYRLCDPQTPDAAVTAEPTRTFDSIDDALAAARASLKREFGDAVTLGDLNPAARPQLARLAVRSGGKAEVRERKPFEAWFPGLG